MSSTGHLSVQPGKKVIVHMRSGDKLIGKFIERKSSKVVIDAKIGIGDVAIPFTIPTDHIRTISIYKGETNKMKPNNKKGET